MWPLSPLGDRCPVTKNVPYIARCFHLNSTVEVAKRTMMDKVAVSRAVTKLIKSGRVILLYRGTRLQFEFERTASRLTEMQSNEYLHAAHLG